MDLRDWSGATMGLARLWKLWDVGLYHPTDPRFVQSLLTFAHFDHCTLWSDILSKYFVQEDPKKGDYYGGAKPDKIIFRYGSRNGCGQVQQKLSKNNISIVWMMSWKSRRLNCKKLPSHTGQEQACSRITWLFVRLTPCRKWRNAQEMAVDCPIVIITIGDMYPFSRPGMRNNWPSQSFA